MWCWWWLWPQVVIGTASKVTGQLRRWIRPADPVRLLPVSRLRKAVLKPVHRPVHSARPGSKDRVVRARVVLAVRAPAALAAILGQPLCRCG